MRSLHDGVDTSTSTGRMVAGILMSIAEYERELVRERTALKLEHARKSGRKFGRPAKLTSDQAALARRMKANGETAATICRTLGIGRTTLYRYLAERRDCFTDSPASETVTADLGCRATLRCGTGRRSCLPPSGGNNAAAYPRRGHDRLLGPRRGPRTVLIDPR